MNKHIRTINILACMILAVGCATRPPVLESDVPNFHIVDRGVMRSGQPTPEGLAFLQQHYGLKTIVNLNDHPKRIKKERAAAKKLGIKYIGFPMDGWKKQRMSKIDQALAEITNKANQPVLVHCHFGKDRTGLIVAAYRMGHGEWTQDMAIQEMLEYGYDRECCANLEVSLKEWAVRLPQ